MSTKTANRERPIAGNLKVSRIPINRNGEIADQSCETVYVDYEISDENHQTIATCGNFAHACKLAGAYNSTISDMNR